MLYLRSGFGDLHSELKGTFAKVFLFCLDHSGRSGWSRTAQASISSGLAHLKKHYLEKQNCFHTFAFLQGFSIPLNPLDITLQHDMQIMRANHPNAKDARLSVVPSVLNGAKSHQALHPFPKLSCLNKASWFTSERSRTLPTALLGVSWFSLHSAMIRGEVKKLLEACWKESTHAQPRKKTAWGNLGVGR